MTNERFLEICFDTTLMVVKTIIIVGISLVVVGVTIVCSIDNVG